MTIDRTRVENGSDLRLIPDMHGDPVDPTVETAEASTPYWLLWSTGIVAAVLCAVAFVLWGINGTSTLFDMIVAFCT